MLSILVLNSWMQWIKWCIESNGWSYLPIEMTENKMHKSLIVCSHGVLLSHRDENKKNYNQETSQLFAFE